jgi:hypothetical protein
LEYISVPADIAAKVGIVPSDEVAVMTRCSDWRELSGAQCKVLARPPEKLIPATAVWGGNAYILSMRDGGFWYISCDGIGGVSFAGLTPILGDSYLTVRRTDWAAFTWNGLGDVLSESWEKPDGAK